MKSKSAWRGRKSRCGSWPACIFRCIISMLQVRPYWCFDIRLNRSEKQRYQRQVKCERQRRRDSRSSYVSRSHDPPANLKLPGPKNRWRNTHLLHPAFKKRPPGYLVSRPATCKVVTEAELIASEAETRIPQFTRSTAYRQRRQVICDMRHYILHITSMLSECAQV